MLPVLLVDRRKWITTGPQAKRSRIAREKYTQQGSNLQPSVPKCPDALRVSFGCTENTEKSRLVVIRQIPGKHAKGSNMGTVSGCVPMFAETKSSALSCHRRSAAYKLCGLWERAFRFPIHSECTDLKLPAAKCLSRWNFGSELRRCWNRK